MRPAPLDRKLLRDLWRMKWQAAAIALLIACGVSVMVMAFSAQQALARAQERFYADTRFADAFADLRRAPRSRLPALAAIPGVTALDARVTASGLMEVPGLARPALVRLIALPPREGAGLNRISITRGRLPDPASLDEAVALQSFMEAAGVSLGQRLTATLEGRSVSLRIVGAARSPEYVYAPSPQSFMPDDAHQAVLWAPAPAVDRAAGLQGGFNSLALKLAPGASLPRVLQAVDRLTAPYGGRASYGRADQPSHAFLEAELRELSISASILPPVFLLIAAALTHMVITRLVEAEREQIGLFKAFGYGNAQAAAPYVKLAAAIGLVGAAGGGLGGVWLAAAIVEQYRQYFRFPVLDPSFDWPAFGLAASASVAAALAGSALAARRAARLSPAIAMQPPRPAAYRQGLLDRLVPGHAVDAASRMIVRNLERFPGRAVLTTLGLAASLALLVGSQFVFGSLDHVIDQAYYRAQRWSDSIGFAEARSAGALAQVRRLPGVFAAEPVRIVAVRARANGREERTRLTGLAPDARLNRPLDAAGRPLALAGPGVVLSAALARRLGLAAGDRVRLDILDGRAPSVLAPVTGLAEDYSGFAVYMDRGRLNALMADGDLISGAQLQVAPDAHPAFYRALEAAPQILAAASRDETVANWRAVMIEAFRTSMTFYVGFAAAIAFGVAFNTSRIALSERARDLATLRVLGFERRDCAYILLGELLVLGLVALPIGLAGGHLLAAGLVQAYGREELRLPLVLTAESYAVSLAAYVAAIALAALLVGRRIWSLDMVSVLKTRE
ncbi:putative ABC transport system permease protein [Caulobacter ginsengisoli]|uniref:ABC transport system permease protein n=1 Tax=Caulobacter ginsengisoli TaxID=400775 RepID=A0ABU0IY81_9CAUL|nr:FtsX-like permease family protein [Caulobacter ginsengisoli]MDQ0466972.1 putative ABC transport system permease protein [Caulobacter ginsengisoli]